MKIITFFLITWGATAYGGTHIITIEGMKFNPDTIKVKAGDTVKWINKDFFPHTVTAETFDSKSIESSSAWSMKTSKAGHYSYKCNFHPTMHGTLEVISK